MNPQSQQEKCCDGECNHDDCCGKMPENCTHTQPPTEVSQSEGWEERVISFIREIGIEDHIPALVRLIRHEKKITLSTLVKEMEGLRDRCDCIAGRGETHFSKRGCPDKQSVGFNAGISAAIEVVKKMGV